MLAANPDFPLLTARIPIVLDDAFTFWLVTPEFLNLLVPFVPWVSAHQSWTLDCAACHSSEGNEISEVAACLCQGDRIGQRHSETSSVLRRPGNPPHLQLVLGLVHTILRPSQLTYFGHLVATHIITSRDGNTSSPCQPEFFQ